MMTDDEYEEYLDALARRHLKPGGLYRVSPERTAERLTYRNDGTTKVREGDLWCLVKRGQHTSARRWVCWEVM